MRKWSDYKKTFPNEPDIFDLARNGDLRGLADFISKNPNQDLNQKNHRGYAPLMLAVYNHQNVFCETLLRAGVDPNTTDSLQNTALMAAAYKGNLGIAKILIQFGADPALKNCSNLSAYDWAKTFDRKEITLFFEKNCSDSLVKEHRLKVLFRFIKLILIALQGSFLKKK